jgi:hypothetical protein
MRRRGIWLAPLLVWSVTSCGAPASSGAPEVGAEAYVAAISEFLPPPPPEDASLPVVFVAPVGTEALTLDDQVAMIDLLADTHDLRFVDEPGAAVKDGEGDHPPRDDGLLLGLGTLPAEPPFTVRVEVYTDAAEIDAYLVTVAARGDTWRTVSTERVEPEGLGGEE